MDLLDAGLTAGAAYLGGPVAAAATAAYLGQQDTNSTNIALSQNQQDFQERMSNTAYQRQVKDLEAAGLNPMLAYIKGGGASTPSGSLPVVQNSAASGANAGLSVAQAYKTSAETSKVPYEIAQIDAQTRKVSQEINNLQTENDKAKALIDNIRQEYQNLFKQNLNLTEVGNVMRKQIDLMSSQITNFTAISENTYVQTEINRLEKQLRGFDVKAATDTGNLGREYNQLKGLLDVFRTLTRK